MNINDILMSDKPAVRVLCGSRVLVGQKDFNNEWYYEVSEKNKVLVKTENEDEACRWLTSLK